MRYSDRRQRPMLRTNRYKREQKPIKYDRMKTARLKGCGCHRLGMDRGWNMSSFTPRRLLCRRSNCMSHEFDRHNMIGRSNEFATLFLELLFVSVCIFAFRCVIQTTHPRHECFLLVGRKNI